jgi:hypothetical protein
VYDYPIVADRLISAINIVSTPIVDGPDCLRYSHTDIESISVIHNDIIVETIVNYDRSPSWGLVPLYIYQSHTISLLPSNLFLNSFNGKLIIRVIFWREPVSPVWLQLTYV